MPKRKYTRKTPEEVSDIRREASRKRALDTVYTNEDGHRFKPCTLCHEILPLTETYYYRLATAVIGFTSQCKTCTQAKQRSYWRGVGRAARYNLPQDGYDRLFDAQYQACAVCNETDRTLCIDHNHETGEVRGLVCADCNKAIGMLRDDPKLLTRGADYLTNGAVAAAAILSAPKKVKDESNKFEHDPSSNTSTEVKSNGVVN